VSWQVETRADPAKRIEFATQLIAKKIANSIDTLEAVIPTSRSRMAALLHLRREHDALRARSPDTVARLLGIEGRAAELLDFSGHSLNAFV
jgi:CRISPR/Cas system-associated endonuclease Cas1